MLIWINILIIHLIYNVIIMYYLSYYSKAQKFQSRSGVSAEQLYKQNERQSLLQRAYSLKSNNVTKGGKDNEETGVGKKGNSRISA